MEQQVISSRENFSGERKWALGLQVLAYLSSLSLLIIHLILFLFDQQSRAHPREIMIEVLKALQDLNVCWKKIGHYNMKCRYCRGLPNTESMLNSSPRSNDSFIDESAIVETDQAGRGSAVVKFEIQVRTTLSLVKL